MSEVKQNPKSPAPAIGAGDVKIAFETAVIHIEYMDEVVARLRPKKIVVFAIHTIPLTEGKKVVVAYGEIVNDGRLVYKKTDGKWYWEINP